MDQLERIRFLEEQVRYLLEEKRTALSALELAASLGAFESSLNQLDEPTIILHETASRVRTLVRFKAISFFLVDEEDSRFYQAYCDPESRRPAFEREADLLIEDRTFAWSLGRNKPVHVTTSGGETLMLHALSTASRTRGMFLGVLAQDKRDILDSSAQLLTIILLASAHALESFELYRRIREINRSLEAHVTRLQATEQALRRQQETLEEQVAARTAELADSNASLQREVAERKASEQALRESEGVVRALLDASTEVAVLLEPQGRILALNEITAARYGLGAAELMGRDIRDFMSPEVYSRRRQVMDQVLQSGQAVRFRDENGPRRFDTNICPVFDNRGRVASLAVFARDITRELEAQEEIRKLSQAVVHSPALITITDAAGIIEYVNPKFTSVTGYGPQEVKGQKPSILKSGRHDPSFYAEMWDTITAGREWRGEICNRTKDGREYWAMTSISPILDEAGRIAHYVAVAEDISKRIVQEEHIRYLALHDALTGLPNRNLFMDRLAHAISMSGRHQTRAVVMYVDLNDFKLVNDEFGHEAGDDVLREAAHRLSSCIRTVDSVARVGGDEFVIILQDIRDNAEIELVAQRVIERFREPFVIHDANRQVGASIGISTCPEDGEDVDTLLRKADLAMYAMKRGEKDLRRYYSTE